MCQGIGHFLPVKYVTSTCNGIGTLSLEMPSVFKMGKSDFRLNVVSTSFARDNDLHHHDTMRINYFEEIKWKFVNGPSLNIPKKRCLIAHH